MYTLRTRFTVLVASIGAASHLKIWSNSPLDGYCSNFTSDCKVDSNDETMERYSKKQLESAAHAIAKANRVVCFTGTGMTYDYSAHAPRQLQHNSIWESLCGMLSLIYVGTPFGWTLTPAFVWSQYVTNSYEPIANISPHEGYSALAKLCAGFSPTPGAFSIITTNVDGLHEQSGVNSSCIYELHGCIRRYRCVSCGESIHIANPIVVKELAPRCVSCGGHPRPDATLCYEGLPKEAWGCAVKAVAELRQGDVLLVVGAESAAYPASSLPSVASRNGATIIEINPTASSPFDAVVNVHLMNHAAVILPALFTAVERINKTSVNQ